MKIHLTIFKPVAALLFFSSCICNTPKASPGAKQLLQNNVAPKSIAVLELFTSEGCSSCPAADKLAAALQQKFSGNLLVLEFHVDYWNRLGWKDSFSSHAYSERQQAYGVQFALGGVYTPQAVINGSYEYVGSNEEKLTNAIENQIATTATSNLLISVKNLGSNTLSCSYDYQGTRDVNINIALVQKHAATQVHSGENTGRQLLHTNVVRDFVTIKSDDEAKQATLQLPTGAAFSNYAVIAYAQDKTTHNITCAALSKNL